MEVSGRQEESVYALRALVAVGIPLALVGNVILTLAWPDDRAQSGSWVGAALGGLLALLGGCMLFVGLVGYGVMLGNKASAP